jgi:hypothetical protein
MPHVLTKRQENLTRSVNWYVLGTLLMSDEADVVVDPSEATFQTPLGTGG